MNTPFHAHDAPAHPIPRQRVRSMRGFVVPAVFLILLVALVGSAFFVISKKKTTSVATVNTYEECTSIPGSVIQESFPPVCVTPQGQRFTQTNSANPVSMSPTPLVSDILISEPRSGSLVTSPFAVRGIVPAGWMFEGSFPISLTDEQGTTIAQTTAKETIPGSWTSGLPVNFEAQFSFKTSIAKGFIVLMKDNPSGLPENDKSYKHPVVFTITGPELACTANGGTYDSKYKECTGITKNSCEEYKGTYNDCASVCRHSSDPSAPCVMMCVALCEFK